MIGSKIAKLLEERNISKAEFAMNVGLSPQAVNNIINGADTKSSNIKRIADFFMLPVGYFFDETEKSGTTVNGDRNNVASGTNSRITILENNIQSRDIEIEHLKQIIEEKERLIQFLMEK